MMYPPAGLHREIALDRQAQLLRDAGVANRAAPHLAELAAEAPASPPARIASTRVGRLVVALAARRPATLRPLRT